jgi:hypothetical protein
MSRWYRIRRTYRVYDDAYVFAENADHARDLAWFSVEPDDTHDYAVTHPERSLDTPLVEKHARPRRVEPEDVPAWIREMQAAGWPEATEAERSLMDLLRS